MLNGDKEVIMNRNLGIPEACKISGISRAMLYKLIKAGEGPPITKIGRRSFISSDSLNSWLKKMEQKANKN